MANNTVLVPLKADAFCLSPDCASPTNHYCIGPITQPNHAFLRLDDALLTSDILDHVDLHSAIGASNNSRITDIGTGKTRQRRLGVYLHWTLPYFYRVATSVAEGGSGSSDTRQQAAQAQVDRKKQAGYPSRSTQDPSAQSDLSIPDYRPIPNRWMITRHLDLSKVSPQDAVGRIPEVETWIIQSDALRNVNDLPPEADLETDVSPFIDPADLQPSSDRVINGPAEVFVGKVTPTASWDPATADKDPHVNLTVMTSSNPLFVDYQPHNSNVLSYIDNFQYTAANGTVAYLTEATADYSVIGWHSSSDDDPFTTVPGTTVKHSERLTQCRMVLKDATSGSATSWPDSPTSSRVLCHATMYAVKYSSSKQPTNVPAEAAGKLYHDHQPVAVGVTPMDALLAYTASYASGTDANMNLVVRDLKKLEGYLRQTESDDIDGLQAATDEAYEQAFTKLEAGTRWHYGDQSAAGAAPISATPDIISNLSQLNAIQMQLDSAAREVDGIRWKLFAEWWIALSDFSIDRVAWNKRVADFFARLSQLASTGSSPGSTGRILELAAKLVDTTNKLRLPNDKTNTSGWSLDKMPAMPSVLNKGASDRFFQRKDPTLFFGNLASAFEVDFLDDLQVRLGDQVVRPAQGEADQGWKTFASVAQGCVGKVPAELSAGCDGLLQEFFALRAKDTPVVSAGGGQVIPWFHHEVSQVAGMTVDRAGRDAWNDTQPWHPLFIEWEASYYHIPFEKWDFTLQPGHYKGSTVHYAVKDDVSAMKNLEVRHLSGRNILTPQAQSTLKTTLSTIFANTPKSTLEASNLGDAEQTAVLDAVSKIATVSAPLNGLTSHLLTLHEGTHFKPLVRLPNEKPSAINVAVTADPTNPKSALRDIVDLNVNKDPLSIFAAIQGSGSSTPYAASVAGNLYQLPVTHGQFVFTKLNIIDKFGQVVPCINPLPLQKGKPFVPVCPAISDSLWVGMVGEQAFTAAGARLNCAVPQSNKDACPFISLPPAINQPARLNASFVHKVRDASGSFVWRSTTEWDNPVFGWLVINYADRGIQLFRANGQFYREVRLGGRYGTVTGPARWLPFPPPADATSAPDTQQLDYFIAQLASPGDDSYVQGVVEMIEIALGDGLAGNTSLPHAPASYAEYASAIVGKPLALCAAGFSLELASEPALNWSTSNPGVARAPPRTLLPGDSQGAQWPPDAPGGYTFPVKLGDADRLFDGLVGVFPASSTLGEHSSDLDYGTLHTPFVRAGWTRNGRDPRRPIEGAWPRLTPYWGSAGAPGAPLFDHDARLHVVGMLVDPFLAVHAYSAVLPNRALKLPPWAVEQALKRMTAFWHVGPIVAPWGAVPAYDASRNLADAAAKDAKGDYGLGLAAAAAEFAPPTIPIPLAPPIASKSGGGAAYRFLQPYVVQDQGGAHTVYNAWEIAGGAAAGMEGVRPQDKGPYSAIEGYLQIVKGLDAL